MRELFKIIGGFLCLMALVAGIVFVFSGGYHAAMWLIDLIF